MTGHDPRPALVVPTRALARIDTLAALFADHRLVARADTAARAVLTWGRKPSATAAARLAHRLGLPTWRLEDGFLRSLELGHREPPLSVVVDDLGIYYDAGRESRLERLVALPLDATRRERAERLATAWRTAGVSKYNHAREQAPDGPAAVLVVDQTEGDASIAFGQADGGSFARMLEAALDEHPQLSVWLKVHPDVLAGRKRGHFGALSAGAVSRIAVVARDVAAPVLLQHAVAVYTVTSQLGFEALVWGRPVRCFGMPFYAGWGLTQDQAAPPARRQPVALAQLVHAALVDYARCIDPETGRRCEVERLIDWMALQRRQRARFAPTVHALGFSRWKQPLVRRYFSGSHVRFVRDETAVPPGGTLAVWGSRAVASGRCRDVVRIEDGFLRSVGLGAALTPPLSWVMDQRGVHYDPALPSELEWLLAHSPFDAALLARAQALRERIVAARLSKYNIGSGSWRSRAPHRPMVLVVGQVESDASVLQGSAPALRRNVDLLRAVRTLRPSAWLVYKPHPDVVSGLRRAGVDEARSSTLCDEVVSAAPLPALIDAASEVHVLTSLAGFEALLRGKTVHCHGLPFYAGWGLTVDARPHPRRQRRLALDELVAGALILYPTYLSRATGRFTTPERVVDELVAWRSEAPAPSTLLQRFWLAWRRWRVA